MKTDLTKEIEHVWSVLCANSVTDSDSNNISLNNVLEQLQVTPPKGTLLDSKEKTVKIDFELITLWRKLVPDAVSTETRVEIVDPDGRVLLVSEHPLRIDKQYQRFRSRTRFNGLKITTPGHYVFLIKLKVGKTFEEFGRTYLEVKVAISK